MDLPSAIDHVRPAVVQIRIQRDRLNKGAVVGTGFWVHGDGLVLTARHVTRDSREQIAKLGAGRLVLGMAIPNLTGPPVTIRSSFGIVEAEVVEEDPRHDVALLRAADNPFSSGRSSGVQQVGSAVTVNPLYGLADFSDAPVRDGEHIAVSGYPLAEPALITTSGGIASAFGTDVAEVQAPRGPVGLTIPDTADSYLADVAVNPGNSGGPVYRTSDGTVIGVCVAFKVASAQLETQPSPFFYNSGLSVVVPIKYGLDLVSRHAS